MTKANHYFGSQNGSENFYRHNLSGIVYTDGIKELAEKCNAYWLLDLIVSHQLHEQVKNQPFQVWDLQREKESAFTIRCTDGNFNYVTSQEIAFSDFEYDLATVWLVDGCIMLPSEY